MLWWVWCVKEADSLVLRGGDAFRNFYCGIVLLNLCASVEGGFWIEEGTEDGAVVLREGGC